VGRISVHRENALKRLLVLIALLWPLLAVAQFACVPKSSFTPSGPGSRIVESSRQTPDIGDWAYWWCPVDGSYYPDGRAGAWQLEKHAVLAKYRGLPASGTSAVWQALATADVLGAINAVVATFKIAPATPQELYEYRLLRYAACLDAATPPYIVDVAPLPAGWCGPAPVPPGPPAAVCKTPLAGNTIWTASNGILTSNTGRKAPPDAPCDCATLFNRGTSTYGSLIGGPAEEVTLCKKVTP
jgi:hypothetical protein